MSISPRAVLPIAIVALLAPGARLSAAQQGRDRGTSVTASDIQRLQDEVYTVSNDISSLRDQDRSTADRLQARLDDLHDEVIYLKVKLRKEGFVSRSEYADVRKRVANLRSQAEHPVQPGTGTFGAPPAQSQPYPPPPPPPPPAEAPPPYGGVTEQQVPTAGRVPAGQELDVRIDRDLSSATAQVEDRFVATTILNLYQGNTLLIPAGARLRGVVSSVDKANRLDRKGSLTVAFDQITINGRSYPIHATVTQAIQSEGIKGDAGKIGAGAGVGAVIGGILGGVKGAALGILIGGGGTMAATPGKDVTLPAGSVLRVRFDEPLQLK